MTSNQRKSLRFPWWYSLWVWWQGFLTARKMTGEEIPLGTLEPTIAEIQHRGSQRLHRLEQYAAKELGPIRSKVLETSTRFDDAENELVRREIERDKEIDRYQDLHGKTPPRRGPGAVIRDWAVIVSLGGGELPLSYSALKHLEMPEWLILIATLATFVLTISLAGLLGRLCAKPNRTRHENIALAMIAALLLATLITMAAMRSHAALEPVPEVLNFQKGAWNV
jgi:hypothetical protein